MKLIVGYQLREDARFMSAVLRHREQIGEVYFAWPGVANGRSSVHAKGGFTQWELLLRQREDLSMLSCEGFSLNLLLNGNCYGDASLARSFFTELGNLVDSLGQDLPTLTSVTTTSPVIARFIKQNFPGLEVRASVNMEISTPEGVAYIADVMDGFYIKRELNRRIDDVRHFAAHCHTLGKKVYLLANSGCLNYCSARTFHDNLVSHEAGIMQMDNAYRFEGQCRSYLADPEHRRDILRLSNWLHPRELCRYADFIDGFKLATRVSENPDLIIDAYATGSFHGNLLSLMEPDLSALFLPEILCADRLPDDLFDVLRSCDRDCSTCNYCAQAFDAARLTLSDDVLFE